MQCVSSLAVLPLLKHVTMVSKEDKIALVVQRHNTSSSSMRLTRKQGGYHALDAVAQPGGEVVGDELRLMCGWTAGVRYVTAELDVAHLEASGGSVGKLDP